MTCYSRPVPRIFAILLAALAARPAQARDLQFGFTPVLSESDMHAEFDPLMAYLSDSIGQKVVLYIAKDYGDLRTQMESGAVDIGTFSPFAYVDAARGGKVRLIAQCVINGTASYRGVIIARTDTGLKSLADLRGKRFAFVDPKSASGYVYPRALLMEHGIAPEKVFKQIIFAGSHDKVIADVLEGRADAGAVYEDALGIAKTRGLPTENLLTLASTDPIPHDAIAVRTGLDHALSKKILAALVDLDKSDAGRRVIANSKPKQLTGYTTAEDSLYNVVRRTAHLAGTF